MIITDLNKPKLVLPDLLTISSIYATSNFRNAGFEQIVSTSTPTTRFDGSPLVVGDNWLNPTAQKLRNWDGTRWISELMWMPHVHNGSIALRFTSSAGDLSYPFVLPRGSP